MFHSYLLTLIIAYRATKAQIKIPIKDQALMNKNEKAITI